MNREEYDSKYKWNLKDLFNCEKDFLKEIKSTEQEIKRLKEYKGIILKSSNNLLELLNLDMEISKRIEKVYLYAHLNNDADTLNTHYQELYGIATNLYTKYLESSSFIVPEILNSDYKVIEEFLKENKKLLPYKRLLKSIYCNKKHILNSETEEVLSSYSKVIDSSEEVYSSLTDSDLAEIAFGEIEVNGKKEKLTESNYSVYLRNQDRMIRKQAFDNMYETYKKYANVISSLLKNEVEKNVVNAKVRHFKNSLEASLFSSNINPSIYHNLIKYIHNNLNSIYDYWNLKKQLLKLDELHLYDTYTDVSKSTKKYTFEEARDLVINSTKCLGEDYNKIIASSFNEGWIDSVNNKGKRGGAYCTAAYTSHPFVLMSYEGMLNDVSTLIHELGHAMHYYYAINNQNYQDYDYSIFVAEVASQVNEILLSRYLLDNSCDKNERIKIIDDLLQKYKGSIFRQTMFAEFELWIHEYTEKGNVLTSKNMCDKYYELNKLYFGDNVVVDDLIRYEWERIPHFYMNYYVFKYATSFAASIVIANKIYDGDKNALNNYLKFLKLGCSKDPIASMKVAGIDFSKSDVYDEAMEYMNKLIKMYEGEINE